MKKKVVLSFSGGLDSTTLLAWFLAGGYEVLPVTFNYPSKHNIYERKAASAIIEHYGLSYKIVDLRGIFNAFSPMSSALLDTNEENIPEGHYNDATMSKTVIPGRNMIFSSILSGIAESLNFDIISMAIHQGDHHIYPDCRPDFYKNMTLAIESATEHKVNFLAPFLYCSKTKIAQTALQLNVPVDLTRTCYKPQVEPCGKCGACVERNEALTIARQKLR